MTIVITPSTLPNNKVIEGSFYSTNITATGGVVPYFYSTPSGTVPPTLELNSTTGRLAGLCTTANNYSFTVQVVDSTYSVVGNVQYGNVANIVYTMGVKDIMITPTTLPKAFAGMPYSQQLSGTGGTVPYTFSLSAGSLPPGISLSPEGLVAGESPVQTNPYYFEISMADSDGFVKTQPYGLTILADEVIEILPTSLPAASVGIEYSQTITAFNGTTPYTYTVSVGTLPDGLTLDGYTGELTGTPTTTGIYPFTIRAEDFYEFTADKPYELTVLEHIVAPTSAVQVYVGGTLQTSGYTVTETNPVTVEFDTAPPEGVDVTILVKRSESWYQPGVLTASDGVALQQTNTPPARFLRGL